MPVHTRQIIYISDARFGINRHDIEDILSSSRLNNGANGVSGMLLYSAGVFVQALEGEPETVGDLYARIADDPRHANIDLVEDIMVDERGFDAWAMGFVEAPSDALASFLGQDNTLGRDQVLAGLKQSRTRAGEMLRIFAENAS
jgi:hypothetical protein